MNSIRRQQLFDDATQAAQHNQRLIDELPRKTAALRRRRAELETAITDCQTRIRELEVARQRAGREVNGWLEYTHASERFARGFELWATTTGKDVLRLSPEARILVCAVMQLIAMGDSMRRGAQPASFDLLPDDTRITRRFAPVAYDAVRAGTPAMAVSRYWGALKSDPNAAQPARGAGRPAPADVASLGYGSSNLRAAHLEQAEWAAAVLQPTET